MLSRVLLSTLLALGAFSGPSIAHPVHTDVVGSHPNCLASAIVGRQEIGRIVKRAVDWGYEGGKGPFYWGSINPNYTTCSTGKYQSPINIDGTVPSNGTAPFNMVYPEKFSNVTVENLGFTVELFAPPKTAYIEREGVKYYLVNFHFHAPAEHHLADKAYPAELHLVHKSDSGAIHVVAIYVEDFGEKPVGWLHQFLRAVPHNETDKGNVVKNFPIGRLTEYIEDSEEFWYYEGSLTAPPCTEGVRWVIASHPIPATKNQMDWLGLLMKYNARLTQKNSNVPSSL
ncbi:hypothetical protein HDU93_000237 [Gonapodya sp. JEL0774]|nr:hypothetical protein HDU93_000237 [Gonapodya sp. JEL0774]